MSERPSKCPFAAFSAFGRKMIGHGDLHQASVEPSAKSAGAPASSPGKLEDIPLAFRTLLKHASVVRGKQGNLLILPSISLPSGDLADAPEAIGRWLEKVQKAE